MKNTQDEMVRVLRLTLKKKWFDMIISGEKKEEYREIKQYWIKRLTNQNPDGTVNGKSFYKDYNFVEFINGYGKDAPKMIVRLEVIEMGRGLEKWGAEEGYDYFKIKLGEITDTKNTKQ